MVIIVLAIIVLSFFTKYLHNYLHAFVRLSDTAFVIFLFVWLYRMFSSKQLGIRNPNNYKIIPKFNWKRFKLYEILVHSFFVVCCLFFTLNDIAFNYLIPNEIAGYFIWLSLGIMLGFILCQYEINRVLNKKNSPPTG